MAWTTPRTWVALETVLASLFNTHIRDNFIALREGAIAIASQAANDFIFAVSATQLGRLAAVSGQVPQFNGSAWVMVANPTVSGAWPVGSLYEATVSTNPATLLGVGTWSAFGAGRVTVAIDAGQAEFDTVEETGGSKSHTLTSGEMPSHTHTQNAHDHTLSNMGNVINTEGAGGSSAVDNSGTKTTSSVAAVNQNTGGGGAHNNLQPYIVIYRWKRTA